MKKTCVLLVLAMVFSYIPMFRVSAATPVIANSTFNKDATGWAGGVLDNSDALRSNGKSYKCTFTSGNYSEMACNDVTMIPGNLYELSFYAKSDVAGMQLMPIRIHNTGWTYLTPQTLTTNWEKYTIQFTHSFTNTKGETVNGQGRMLFRIQEKGSVWIDEVYITDPFAVETDDVEFKGEEYIPYNYEQESRNTDMSGFTDMKGHWAENTAKIMKNEGIIDGMEDGTYQPDRGITRAEFLKLLMVRFNLDDNGYEGIYADVSSDSWYAGMIQNAFEIGIINPILVSDGHFNPDSPLTREEAAIMANSYAEYMGYKDKKETVYFADDELISPEAKNSVYSAARKSVTAGFEDNTFRPKMILTRAEAAQMVKNLVECDGVLEIYVDNSLGADMNDGSIEMPFKTIEKAVRFIRENNKDLKHNIYVFVKSGEIFVDKTIEITPEDGGKGLYGVVFSSYGEGQAVLSGGKHYIGGWQLDDAEKGIYKLYAGNVQTRQMYVDGVRMQRARTDSNFQTYTYINSEKTGYVTSDTYLKDYRKPEDLEMVYYRAWTNSRCGVSEIVENKDKTITLIMDQPGFNLLTNKGVQLTVSLPAFFENQYEFIDEPGEWYLASDGWLYFKPFEHQNLDTADVVLPVTETLLTVTGSSEKRAENISFVNMGFKYATWMRPSTENGFSDAQGGRIRQNGDLLQDAAVWAKYTNNLTIEDCTFSKLGFAALNVTDWVTNVRILGNHIYDISGEGMYIGNHGTLGGAVGDDYASKNILVKNNYIHDYGIDFNSSDGIQGMTMQYATVTNNEIYNGRYSGLVMGYGSAGSRYAIDYVNNYIHDILQGNIQDGGAIYVTSTTHGNAERYNLIANNYCVNQGNLTGVLYPDNNTSWWDIYNNVVDQTRSPFWYVYGSTNGEKANIFFSNAKNDIKFHDNYVTDDTFKISRTFSADGPIDTEIGENYISKNAEWPQEALDIIAKSGLEPKYEQKYYAGIQVYDIENRFPVFVAKNETADIYELCNIKAYGRKNTELPTDKSMFRFGTPNPDIISVTEDGKITGIKEGIAELIIYVEIEDVLHTYKCTVYSGDEFSHADTNIKEVMLYTGGSYKLSANAYSKFGLELEIKSVKYESENPSVATVSEDGTVTAVSAGETEITVTVESDETSIIKVPVMIKNNEFSEKFDINEYIVYDFSDEVSSTDGWKTGTSTDLITGEGEGVHIHTPVANVGYKTQFKEELLHMKLKVNAVGGWPSISLRSDTQNGSYGESTQYMVTFNAGNISVQRFNDGVRRTFENPNFASSFEYGKEYDLLIGAINHEDYVEIIVCLDGERVMNFRDYDEDRITEQGYIQVYCRAGDIELRPIAQGDIQ